MTTILVALLSALSLIQGAGIPEDTLPAVLPVTAPFGLPALDPQAAPSAARVALGRALFFDPILSADRSVACASCHDPRAGFADPRPLSVGVFGRTTLRHAPTLYNRAWGTSFMWDGRFATLEEQVVQPIVNELEMALPLKDAVARLAADARYAEQFRAAYGAPADGTSLAGALAAFVGQIHHGDSAVDHFRSGTFNSLSDAERAGLWFFESRGRCWRCHSGPNFSDERFHNTGVGVLDGEVEAGRAAVSNHDGDRGRFKTPTLRGIALTAPYMHDGSLATLADVVAFYRRGANPNPWLDAEIAPIDMTDRDAENLVAFLKALSRPTTPDDTDTH